MSCRPRCTYGQYDPCTNVETELAKKIETVKVGDATASKTDGIVTITKQDIENLGISAGGYSVFSIGTIGPITSENPIRETKADGTTATYTNTSDFKTRLNELISAGITAIWTTVTSASRLYYTLDFIRTGLIITGQTVARFSFAYATDSRIYASTIAVEYDTDQVVRSSVHVEPSSGGATVYLTHSFNQPDLATEPIVSSDGTTLDTAESLYNYVETCTANGISVIMIIPDDDEVYYCPLARTFTDSENGYYSVILSAIVYSTVHRAEIYGNTGDVSYLHHFQQSLPTITPTYRMCHIDTLGAVSASNQIVSTDGNWKNASGFITTVHNSIEDDELAIWKWRYANRVYELAEADGTIVKFVSDNGTTRSVITVDSNGVSVSNI